MRHTSNLESSTEQDFTASTLPFIASVNQGSPRVTSATLKLLLSYKEQDSYTNRRTRDT